jgi:hypothetical protein
VSGVLRLAVPRLSLVSNHVTPTQTSFARPLGGTQCLLCKAIELFCVSTSTGLDLFHCSQPSQIRSCLQWFNPARHCSSRTSQHQQKLHWDLCTHFSRHSRTARFSPSLRSPRKDGCALHRSRLVSVPMSYWKWPQKCINVHRILESNERRMTDSIWGPPGLSKQTAAEAGAPFAGLLSRARNFLGRNFHIDLARIQAYSGQPALVLATRRPEVGREWADQGLMKEIGEEVGFTMICTALSLSKIPLIEQFRTLSNSR